MARNYKNLEIWNLSYELVLDIYKASEGFPESEKGNITSQLRRAAVSITLNIAEGSSRKTKKSFLQFYEYAYGSAKEVEVLLMLCRDLNYIDINTYENLNRKLNSLLIKTYRFLIGVNKNNFFDWFEKN